MDRKPKLQQSSPPAAADHFWLASLAQQQIHGSAETTDLEPGQSLNTRVALPAEVLYKAVIDDGSSQHLVWKIRDMSMTGAYVEMDVSQLHEGKVVELLLRYSFRGRMIQHRLPAKVVRIQLNGAGLRLSYLEPQTFRDLLALLYGK
ncbi:MAG TPA: PilZ domain-containing protein [Acidiferrobacterales bacterium]